MKVIEFVNNYEFSNELCDVLWKTYDLKPKFRVERVIPAKVTYSKLKSERDAVVIKNSRKGLDIIISNEGNYHNDIKNERSLLSYILSLLIFKYDYFKNGFKLSEDIEELHIPWFYYRYSLSEVLFYDTMYFRYRLLMPPDIIRRYIKNCYKEDGWCNRESTFNINDLADYFNVHYNDAIFWLHWNRICDIPDFILNGCRPDIY